MNLAKNNFTPISIQGAIQANNITGRLGIAASIAGFNPAPKYIAQTPMQTKIYAILDQRTGGTKPLAQKAAQDAKTNIKHLYWQGNLSAANAALDAAVKAGYINPAGKATFIKDLDLPGDVSAFKLLAPYPSDQQALFAQMNEQDLARYAAYAANSVKSTFSSISPTTKKFVQDLQSGKIKLDTFKAGKVVTTP